MAYLNLMRPEELLTPTSSGIFCEPGGFCIDPTRPVDKAVITHAHSDHARPGHGAVLATHVAGHDPAFMLTGLDIAGQKLVVPALDFGHDLPAMRAAITADTRVVFIANPNNPTGTMSTRAELDDYFSLLKKGLWRPTSLDVYVMNRDGSGLQQVFLLRWQAVNACCQHGLHRRRDVQMVERLRQAIGPHLAN